MRVSALLCLALLSTLAHAQIPTAQQVIDRVEKDLASTAPPHTVDTYKAGDPATPITGIATTFLPTMFVMRQCVAQHINLILTHEPTFYNHPDKTAFLANDPVYKEKLAYINAHHLVIFRMHDTMHASNPDPIYQGFLDTLHWRLDPDSSSPNYYVTIPRTSILALAHQLATTLHDPAIRVVGDPNLKVTHAAIALGAGGELTQIKDLEHPNIEVLIAGEASEWETVEYARDASQQGRHIALILLGHNASEEIGMKPFAARIQRLVPDIPVKFIPAGEPYWPLDHPPIIH